MFSQVLSNCDVQHIPGVTYLKRCRVVDTFLKPAHYLEMPFHMQAMDYIRRQGSTAIVRTTTNKLCSYICQTPTAYCHSARTHARTHWHAHFFTIPDNERGSEKWTFLRDCIRNAEKKKWPIAFHISCGLFIQLLILLGSSITCVYYCKKLQITFSVGSVKFHLILSHTDTQLLWYGGNTEKERNSSWPLWLPMEGSNKFCKMVLNFNSNSYQSDNTLFAILLYSSPYILPANTYGIKLLLEVLGQRWKVNKPISLEKRERGR